MHGRFHRLLLVGGIMVLLSVGASYTWTFTPSYSLYRIRQALLAHDYATFSHYVDVDSVLDHALDEFAEGKPTAADESAPRGALGKLLKKGILKNFVQDAREVVKAGLEIALEQAVKDQERPLPEIPAFAVVAALWHGRADDDIVRFPVKVKKGGEIDIKARQTQDGLWRVVEISNLRALLPALKRFKAKEEAQTDGPAT
jgi:hypothetical protein